MHTKLEGQTEVAEKRSHVEGCQGKLGYVLACRCPFNLDLVSFACLILLYYVLALIAIPPDLCSIICVATSPMRLIPPTARPSHTTVHGTDVSSILDARTTWR
jgi:hypothetical protein